MSFLLRMFPAGHFVISVLFLLAGAALIALAVVQLWQGVQLFESASPPRCCSPPGVSSSA